MRKITTLVGYAIGVVLAIVGILLGNPGKLLTWALKAGSSVSISTSTNDLYRGYHIVRLNRCRMFNQTWEPGWYALDGLFAFPMHDQPFATEAECKEHVHTMSQA